jgi:hypothetical protein
MLVALAAFAAMGAAPPARRVDALGDPLPEGAIARLGTARFRCEGSGRSVLSPDGKLIVVGGRDGVQLLEASTGRFVRRLRPDSILSFSGEACFSPDGKLLAAWNSQETHLVLLDVARGGVVRELESPARDARVSFSAKGGLVAVGGQSHTNKVSVLLYDADGKKLKTFKTEQWSVCPLLSPDGKALATWSWGGRDKSVQLWDVAKGEKTRTLSLDGSCVGAAFSPDGNRLAVLIPRKDSSSLLLFDVRTGKKLARAAARRWSFLATYSPDGNLLATGGEDTTVLLWDVTGRTRFAAVEPKDAEPLWADLVSDDAAKAHRAMARLTASPKAAVALFGKHLKPAAGKPLGEKEVKRLIDALGDESFEQRQKAHEALKKAGRAVRPALLARRSDKDLEVRRRVNELVAAMARSTADRATLRSLRAVEVLERLGTPEARRLLAALAKGNPDARVTADAAASLKRLQAR